MAIRRTCAADIPALQKVLQETELFSSDMLPQMLADFLSGDQDAGVWLTCDADGAPVGFCYAVPEALADGTWNMLAIAVLPEVQGCGHG